LAPSGEVPLCAAVFALGFLWFLWLQPADTLLGCCP
jgi:hypothetical protein